MVWSGYAPIVVYYETLQRQDSIHKIHSREALIALSMFIITITLISLWYVPYLWGHHPQYLCSNHSNCSYRGPVDQMMHSTRDILYLKSDYNILSSRVPLPLSIVTS